MSNKESVNTIPLINPGIGTCPSGRTYLISFSRPFIYQFTPFPQTINAIMMLSQAPFYIFTGIDFCSLNLIGLHLTYCLGF